MREKGLIDFPGNFEPQVAAPLDGRTRVELKSDLILRETWTAGDGELYLPHGITVIVYGDTSNNNGFYYLPKNGNYSQAGDWVTSSSFSQTQEERLKDLVYEEAGITINASQPSFEKGINTTLNFTWSVSENDSTASIIRLNGATQSLSFADGENRTYQINSKVTKSVELYASFTSKGNPLNITKSATANAYIPQFIGKTSSDTPSINYSGLNAYTKRVQGSTNLSTEVFLNNEYLFFICNSPNKIPRDDDTQFTLSIGEWSNETAFFIKKGITIFLADGTTENCTLYRTREKKTQLLKISLI